MSSTNFPFNPIDFQGSPHDFAGDNNLGIYQEEAIQRYVPGTRFTRWDGGVFKYGKSRDATLKSGFGAFNDSTAVNISVTAPTLAEGDRSMILVFASGDGVGADGILAEKELVGGYFVTGHGVTTVQTRLIIDTDGVGVTGVGGNITLFFDGPISDALTTPFTEVALNPYRYLKKEGGQYASVMGVPAANITATYYCWIQTWGPCWITPGGADGSPGDTANDRKAYFVGDGTVNFGAALAGGSDANHVQEQLAGFCIDETASGTSAFPLIMLQLSI